MAKEKDWPGTTYGGNRLHAGLLFLLRHVNVRIVYVFASIFVVPVCMVFNSSTRIIYRYFRKRHHDGRIKAAWRTYLCHCMFAQVVIDKFAMFAGRRFRVRTVGYEQFIELDDGDDGFVQLSSHIGNYEIAGYSLPPGRKMMNALVFGGEKETVMANREKMFGHVHIRMIPVSDDMSHLYAINAALADNEVVSMPADRATGSEKTIRMNFLGAEADFPMGAFSVATARQLNVLAVNVMKTSARKYTVYVTSLKYDKTATRKEQIRQLAESYKDELERMVRRYPTQWYNFYEFWN